MDLLNFRHVYAYREGMTTIRQWLEFANQARTRPRALAIV